MDEKKSIWNYIGQLFATFGMIVGIFMIFGLAVGNMAAEYSTLFALGSAGLSMVTLGQLLLLALLITIAQVLFLTDRFLKRMGMVARYIGFFGWTVVVMVVFAILFRWFPIHEARAWIGFGISFVICTGISICISKLEERAENKKMEKALQKFQEEEK